MAQEVRISEQHDLGPEYALPGLYTAYALATSALHAVFCHRITTTDRLRLQRGPELTVYIASIIHGHWYVGGQETGLGGISWSCVGPASRKFQSSLLHELPELKKGGTPKPRSTTTSVRKTTLTCCLASNMTPLRRAMLIQKRNKGQNLLPISSPLTLHPPHLTLPHIATRDPQRLYCLQYILLGFGQTAS